MFPKPACFSAADSSAALDVYPSDAHAFDMMRPEEPVSWVAALRFNEQFAYAKTHYFAPQKSR